MFLRLLQRMIGAYKFYILHFKYQDRIIFNKFWFLFLPNFAKNTRRSLGYVCVFCLISKKNNSKILIKPNSVLVLIFYILHLNPLSAQTEIDNQLWQGVTLDYKATDNITFHLHDELRLENNISDFQQNLIQLHTTIKVAKAFRVLGGYRFAIRPVYDRHRFFVQPLFRREIKNIRTEIQFSTNFQYEFDKRDARETFYVRPMFFARFEPKYSRIEPFFATELFYQISPESMDDQLRIYVGVEYKLTKKNTLRLAYIRANTSTFNSNIFSAIYILEIDPPKKKKK